MKNPTYSVVLPVYNEATALPQLIREITDSMKKMSYEVIAVDDGSTDRSHEILEKISQDDPHLAIIHLKKHQGKWAALRTGIAKAHGDIIITIDSDLQDDPKEIPKLLKKLNQGYDVVSGWRKNRQDAKYKILFTKLANVIISHSTHHHFHDFSSPMKAYRRTALNELPKQGSLLRYSLLFTQKLGLVSAEVPVHHRLRTFGTSKFGPMKYLRILYDIVLIFLLFSGSGRIYARQKGRNTI